MGGAVVDQPALRAMITRFQGFLELTVVWQSKTTALGKAWCGHGDSLVGAAQRQLRWSS
jgi:hypothetical protein